MSLRDKMNRLLLKIPKNKLTTYKALATALNTSPRAIAMLLKTNKQLDNIPCYKVVMTNGHVGGYSKGINEKIKKLKQDNIPIINKRVKNLEKYLFRFEQDI